MLFYENGMSAAETGRMDGPRKRRMACGRQSRSWREQSDGDRTEAGHAPRCCGPRTVCRPRPDDKFAPSLASTDDLVKAHEELGRRVGQEGTVLMKNDDQALPLAKGSKLTLLGMGSMYPFLGGKMGSTITTEAAVDLVSALEQGGFEINPTMTDIYETLGAFEDATAVNPVPWMKSVVYKYRPAGFATPYVPNEPSFDTYVSEGGASEDFASSFAEYASSFAEYGDAAIVVLSRPGSEGSDYYPGAAGIDAATYGTKNSLGICTNERALIQLAEENFDKVIVMVNSGSTMELGDLKNDPKISAIMNIGFPGAFGTLGIADILNGTVSPSGCLADTYATDTAMAPSSQNFGSIKIADTSMVTWPDSRMGTMGTDIADFLGGENSTQSAYYVVEAEGIYTGYKYYETRYYDSVIGAGNATGAAGASNGASSWSYDNEVVYPFGYGLSYTTFQQTLDDVQVNADEKTVTAKVTVTNTGSVAGKHAAQLYVSAPYTDYDKKAGVEKSAIQLIGIAKTDELKPGDDQQLTITADLYDMASWDSSAKGGKGGWILDGGDYCFVLAENAHAAVNSVLAAQGKGTEGDASMVSIKRQVQERHRGHEPARKCRCELLQAGLRHPAHEKRLERHLPPHLRRPHDRRRQAGRVDQEPLLRAVRDHAERRGRRR